MKEFYGKLNREEFGAEYFVLADDKAAAQKRIFEICGEKVKVTEKEGKKNG